METHSYGTDSVDLDSMSLSMTLKHPRIHHFD